MNVPGALAESASTCAKLKASGSLAKKRTTQRSASARQPWRTMLGNPYGEICSSCLVSSSSIMAVGTSSKSKSATTASRLYSCSHRLPSSSGCACPYSPM